MQIIVGIKAEEENKQVYNAVLDNTGDLEEIDPDYNNTEKEDEESQQIHHEAQTLLKNLLKPDDIAKHKYFSIMFEAEHFPKQLRHSTEVNDPIGTRINSNLQSF